MKKKCYIFKSLKKRERKRDLVKNKWGYNIMFPKVEKRQFLKRETRKKNVTLPKVNNILLYW